MRDCFLRTERLGFSKWTLADEALARELWGNEKVTQYICARGRFTESEVRVRLAAEIENQETYGVQYWPLFALGTGDFVGCCGLRPYEEGVYEIGFHLRPEYWGKGLGEEAARAAIDYGFNTLGARDLFAGHHPKNKSSAALLGKLGFHYDRDEFYEPTGLYHPSYRYI